jgi:hypothetical protein
MKSFILALVTLVTGALAVAPLLRRDGLDSISNNYIIVMKKGLEDQSIQAHLDLVRTNSLNLPGGKRGFVREYHIEEFNAYHIECDGTMLHDIRSNTLVSVAPHRLEVYIYILTIPRSITLARTLS